ncbi:MAG: leishmanolysin-related zinc metalloendopeptidase [Reichenbachiella sp.]|uniref:leishmanolysin-related zinc metalloendopeptidase n=2 Tax=Reichenbachiella sp. TaxID=2184521 RepID=UPI0029667851|nr:leishmanolysin-related zinc metalloendopeptidase [Reichenbachiella sp.]MDW3210635.1 leishmanolysin-related zinc metalloendopeptidase [Reichenbachiella sp.]
MIKPMINLKLIKQSLTLSSLCLALSFTSCVDDLGDTNSAAVRLESPFELVPTGDAMTEIKGTIEDTNSGARTAGNRGRFDITLRYLVPLTDRQLEVFEAAVARWERIIIKDVPSVTGPIPSAFQGVPPIESVDDIVIEVVIAPIDGPGNILGQAGPRYVRTDDFLSLSGVMYFDVADMDYLDELDLFEEVIVHEMGHVLGVGTLWNVSQYGFPRDLREGPDTNPYFNGHMANVHWNAEGGTGELPIENMGGPGTRLSHWRESVLDNELMTGYLNLGENPLSRITAGSLRDLGYGTAVKGESYDLPKGTEGVDINELAASPEGEGLNIATMEVILEPIGYLVTE